jgi:type IV pilus assembly protein PilP
MNAQTTRIAVREALARLLVVSAAASIAACSGDEHSDLKQELNQLTKDVRGKVAPLPQVRPYEPVPYTAEAAVDPFRPERIDVAASGTVGASASKLAPDPNRSKEPLEAFPLESIQMLGTITQNRETFALVKAGSNLYRVKKGNYMGQNFGVITAIDEIQIALKELVQDAGGEWVERSSALQLVEAKR